MFLSMARAMILALYSAAMGMVTLRRSGSAEVELIMASIPSSWQRLSPASMAAALVVSSDRGTGAYLVVYLIDHPLHDFDAVLLARTDVQVEHARPVFHLRAGQLADLGWIAIGNCRLDLGRQDLNILTDDIHAFASLLI
jgi:hypothetical protein